MTQAFQIPLNRNDEPQRSGMWHLHRIFRQISPHHLNKNDLEEAVTTIVSTLQDAASEISGSPDDIEKESERIIERIDEVKQIIVNVVEEVEKGEVIKIHKPKALAGLEELKRLLKLFGFTTTYKRIESSKGDYFGLIVHPEGIEINNMEELGEFVVNYLCKRLVVL